MLNETILKNLMFHLLFISVLVNTALVLILFEYTLYFEKNYCFPTYWVSLYILLCWAWCKKNQNNLDLPSHNASQTRPFFPSSLTLLYIKGYPPHGSLLVEDYMNTLMGKSFWFSLVLWYINHCRLFIVKSCLYIQGAYNNFQTFFVWALLLIVHTWNFSPLQSYFLRLQCTCCTIPTTSGRPHGSPLVWVCQSPSSQPLPSPKLSHNDNQWA